MPSLGLGSRSVFSTACGENRMVKSPVDLLSQHGATRQTPSRTELGAIWNAANPEFHHAPAKLVTHCCSKPSCPSTSHCQHFAERTSSILLQLQVAVEAFKFSFGWVSNTQPKLRPNLYILWKNCDWNSWAVRKLVNSSSPEIFNWYSRLKLMEMGVKEFTHQMERWMIFKKLYSSEVLWIFRRLGRVHRFFIILSCFGNSEKPDRYGKKQNKNHSLE